MSVLIMGITLDDFIRYGGEYAAYLDGTGCTVELPDHGDLSDRDALNATDSWEWIRHDASVVIPAERSEDAND